MSDTLFTLNKPIIFSLPGRPVPSGSKRAFPYRRTDGQLGVRMVDDSGERAKHWRGAVAAEAFPHVPPMALTEDPVSLCIAFIIQRPKNHYVNNNRERPLKKSAPGLAHTGRPDALKLARTVEDSLTGVVYVDDSQISHETLIKWWGDENLTIVVIEPWQKFHDMSIFEMALDEAPITKQMA